MVFTGVVRGQSPSCSDYINALPWTYGFEDATSGSSSTPNASFGATCWTHHNNTTDANAVGYPYIITSNNPHGGTKTIYWYRPYNDGYGDYQILVLPGVDPVVASVNTLELSFWVRMSYENYPGTFIVGVMTDPTDVNTFVAVGEPLQVSGTEWSEVEISLASYTGSGQYVAIRANRVDGVFWSAYVDDFTLSRIENCPAVKNLHVTDCGTNEVTVAWRPKGNASSWEVSLDGVVRGTVTTPTYTFTGLTATTTYTVSVVGNCGGGEQSNPTTLQVSTISEPITTLPYSCDFEGIEALDVVMVNNGQANQWTVGNGANNTANGESSLYIHSSDGSNTYNGSQASTVFAYIPFELQTGSYIIEYDWRCYAEYQDYLRVALVPAATPLTPGTSTGWNQSLTPGISLDGGSGLVYQYDWQHHQMAFDITTAGVYKLVFFWTNNSSYSSQPPAAIDNIRLRANTCPFDSQVYLLSSAQESVTIEWSGSETTYRLEYGPVGFYPGTGTVMNVTDTTATINGLSANTEYDLYLSLVCGEDNVSLPVSFQFATLSGPISSFPWSCDFEGASAEGWEFAGGGSTNHWTIGYSAYNSYENGLYVSSDNYGSYYYDNYSTTEVYAWREMQLEEGRYGFTFFWQAYGEGDGSSNPDDYLSVFLVPEANWGTTNGELLFGPGENLTYWDIAYSEVTVTAPGSYRLLFVWNNDDDGTGYNPAAIDDIEVVQLCSEPTSLSAGNPTSTSATLQWTGSTTSYTVQYGPVTDYDFWNSDYDNYPSYTVDGTSLELNGLVGGTQYIVGIRSLCSPSESSDIASFTFTTPLDIIPMSVPYSCDFESTNSEWHLIGDNNTNQWTIGTATNNTVGGSNALYISDDAGLSNHYSGIPAQLYAVSALSFNAGTYTIDYDWKCSGSYDDNFNVRLVPATSDYTTTSPSSYIALDEGNLRNSSDWTHTTYLFTITTPGNYYLVVYWENTSSVGSQPPAAIDNIVVAPWTSHTTPYSCSFESSNDLPEWYVCNYHLSNTNRWSVGTAAGSTGGGSNSLYISNDGGTSYAATSDYNSYGPMYATTLLTLQAGDYNLSFDWKAVGRDNREFLKVILAPTQCGYQYEIFPWECSSTHIATDALFGASEWQSFSQDITVTQPGDYFLILYWKHSNNDYGAPAAVDNISLTPLACPAPSNLAASFSDGNLQLSWTPSGTESSWRVNDGSNDYIVSSPSFSISNALPAHTYHFSVQALCGSGDESFPVSLDFKTDYYCSDMDFLFSSDPSLPSSTFTHFPLSVVSNYSLSETIIDAAALAGSNYIRAVAFYYEPQLSGPNMTSKNNVDIYFMPTDKSVFSSSSDYVNLSSDAVLVYSGPLNCTSGWNYFEFSTPYLYDGGNLMMIVDDNSGAYEGQSNGNSFAYTFRGRSCDGYKTLVNYVGSNSFFNIDPHNITGSGNFYTYAYRPEMCLITCGSFNATVYHISLQQEGPGTVSFGGPGFVTGNKVIAGGEITITATPDADYSLASLYVNGIQVSSPYTFTPSSDISVQATFLPTAPDLHVVSLSCSPLVNGQQATISFTVRNDGTAPTPAGVSWNDYLYINTSNEPEAHAGNSNIRSLGQFPNLSELAVGESYTQQATVTLPTNLVGNFYLLAVTNERDARNIQCPEGASPSDNSSAPFCTAYSYYSPSFTEITHILNPNRHDNFLATPITIEDLPRPDLHVSQLSVSPIVYGQPVSLSFTVTNDGTAPTPSSWTDRVGISSNPDLSDYTLLGSWDNLSPLDAGESYTRQISLSLPATFGAGTYYLFVISNHSSLDNLQALTPNPDPSSPSSYSASIVGYSFIESGELLSSRHDNLCLLPVEVSEILPDLHVASLSIGSTELATGQQASVSFSVRNDGTSSTPSSWTDYLYISSSPDLENGSHSLLASWDNMSALEPGQSYSRSASVSLPTTFSEGPVYLILLSNKNTLYDIQCPDGTSVFDNSSSPYCSSFRHSETDFASFPELGEPNSLRHDNFLILATSIVESLPDLHVASLSHSDFVTGTDASVSFSVRNDGNAPTPDGSSWSDYLYLSSSPSALQDKILLDYFSHSTPLAPGESYSRTVSVNIPVDAAGDKYLILLSAKNTLSDVQCPAGASTTNNNAAPYCTSSLPSVATLPFVELHETATGRHDNFLATPAHVEFLLPELHVASLSHSVLVSGATASVTFSVRNDGTRSTLTTGWIDRLFISSSPEITVDGTDYSLLGAWSNPQPLNPGESYSRTVSVSIPSSFGSDNPDQNLYYIILTSDANYVYDINCPDGTPLTEPLTVNLEPLTEYCSAHSICSLYGSVGDKNSIEELSEFGTSSFTNDSHTQMQFLHDNFLILPVHIPITPTDPLPQLHTLSLSAPQLVVGHEASISWTVRNEGLVATPDGTSWRDELFLSPDSLNWQHGYSLGSWPNLSALDPLQEYTRTVNITIPQRSSTGDMFLTVASNRNADPLVYGSLYPTIVTIPVEVILPPLPDLQVSSISAPSNFYSGTTVSVSATITNNSVVPTAGNGWTDRLYISAYPDFIEDSAYLVASCHHNASAANPLLPGESYTASFSGSTPLRLYDTSYFFVVTNADNGEFESINAGNNTSRSEPVNIILSAPADLVVSGLNVPAVQSNRDPITVAYTIRNSGSGKPDASSWTDRFYLSSAAPQNGSLVGDPRTANGKICHDVPVDQDWNGNDIYGYECEPYDGTGNWYYPLASASNKIHLLPGASYQGTLSFNLPDFVPSGDYYIVAQADGANLVFEYNNEHNNLRFAPISYTRHEHNFSPTAFDMPSPVVQGYTTSCSFAIENLGGLDYDGRLNVRIYCSTDDTPTFDINGLPANGTRIADTSFQQVSLPSSLSGSSNSTQFSIPLTFPTSIPDGDYHIFLCVNPWHSLPESSYDDNILVDYPFTLCHDCPLPDITATNIVLPSSLTAGRTAQLEFDLLNNGNVDLNGSAIVTALHLSNDGGATWHWCPLASQSAPLPVAHPTTAAHSSSHYLQYVTIPPDLPAGSYSARLSLDISGTISEANEEDNIILLPSSVQVLPYPLSIAVDGSRFKIDGSAPLTQSSPLIVYADQSLLVQWQVFLTESDPAFTSLHDQVTYNPDGRPHQGGYFHDIQGYGYYEYLLWKQLTDNAGVWVDYLWFSSDNTLSDDDTPLGGTVINQQKAIMASYSAATGITLPSSLQGDGYLIFVIDAGEQSFELDRSDNTLVIPIHVAPPLPPPDLAVTAAEIPSDGDIKQGDRRSVEFTVTNVGQTTVQSSWTDYVFDGDYADIYQWHTDPYTGVMSLVVDRSRILASHTRSSSLAPGESYTVEVEVTFPRDTPGPHYLTFYTALEGTGQFQEPDNVRANNNLSLPYELHYAQPADLVASAIQVGSATATVGQNLSVQWTLSNIGDFPLTGTIRDGVYLSTDQTLDNADILIGELSSRLTLAPGANTYRAASFTLVGIPEGTYHVIVRANMPNAFYETSYTNNLAVSQGTLTVSLPWLTIDVAEELTLASGQQVAYQLEIPAEYAGKTLRLTAETDRGDFAFNGLYCSFATPPTAANHHFGSHMPYKAVQDLVIPQLHEGVYYILLTAATADNSQQEVTILAHPVDFSILTLDAARGGNTGSVSTKITGALFDTVMDFRLVRRENTTTPRTYYPAERVNIKDATESFVTFNLTDLPPGSYTVEGELPGGALATLPDGFEVIDGLPGELYYVIYAPDAVRAGLNVEVTVVYGNTGSTDIEVAGFLVTSENNHPIRREGPFSADEIHEMSLNEVWLPNQVTFEVTETGMEDDIIRPGHAGTMRFFIYANKKAGEDFIEFNIYPLQRKNQE